MSFPRAVEAVHHDLNYPVASDIHQIAHVLLPEGNFEHNIMSPLEIVPAIKYREVRLHFRHTSGSSVHIYWTCFRGYFVAHVTSAGCLFNNLGRPQPIVTSHVCSLYLIAVLQPQILTHRIQLSQALQAARAEYSGYSRIDDVSIENLALPARPMHNQYQY